MSQEMPAPNRWIGIDGHKQCETPRSAAFPPLNAPVARRLKSPGNGQI